MYIATHWHILHTGLLAHSKQLLEGYKHLVQAYDGKFKLFIHFAQWIDSINY